MRRRQYLTVSVAAVGMAGCSGIDSVRQQTTDSNGGETPEETAEMFIQAIDAKDVDAFNLLRHTEGNVPEVTASELDAEVGGYDLVVEEVRELHDGEVDGSVIVGIEYLVVDREEDVEATNRNEFELRQEDDVWRVWEIKNDIIVITIAPNVQFHTEFREDGVVEFTHNGGDNFEIRRLHVEIDDDEVPVEGPDGEEIVRAGVTVRAEHPDGEWNDESVALVWSWDGERSVLRRVGAPV